MLILYLLSILLLCIWGIRFHHDNDYLSKEQCNNIKGIFILMIFLTHSMQYIKESGYTFSGIDMITTEITNYTAQLVVVMFLFYSGYGVALQINRKGMPYVKAMPKHRILKTLLNFDIAVCIFILLDIILSRPLSLNQIFLSFLAWDSVGNSNWYIFVILLCYVATYIATSFFKSYKEGGVLLLCFIIMLVLSFVKGTWWYDTILAYPAGYIYCSYRNYIEKWLKQHYFYALFALIIAFIIFHDFLSYYLRGITKNIMGIIFSMIVVMITMKVKIGNKCLQWCGTNLFPLYIYQRIPMIALQALLGDEFVSSFPIVYLTMSVAITCVIAYYYRYWRIDLIEH